MQPLYVKIPKELSEWLEAHCFETKLTKAEVARLALELYRSQDLPQKGEDTMEKNFEYTDDGYLIVDDMRYDPGLPQQDVVRIGESYYMIRHGAGTVGQSIQPEDIKPNRKKYGKNPREHYDYEYAMRGMMPKRGFDVGLKRAMTEAEFKEFVEKHGVKDVTEKYQATKGALFGKKYAKTFTAVQVALEGDRNIHLEGVLQKQGICAGANAPGRLEIRVEEEGDYTTPKSNLSHEQMLSFIEKGDVVYLVQMVKGTDQSYDETSEPRILLRTLDKQEALDLYESLPEQVELEEPEVDLEGRQKYESPVVVEVDLHESNLIRG